MIIYAVMYVTLIIFVIKFVCLYSYTPLFQSIYFDNDSGARL